jgi:hypothetical protein
LPARFAVLSATFLPTLRPTFTPIFAPRPAPVAVVPSSRAPAAADLIAQSQDLSFFKRYYDSYDLMYIDLWNGSEEIPYHFDTINGADTLVLIYLTEELVWSKECGGQISLQKKIKDVILAEEEIDPISETMVVVNNANPLVKHKVTALKNLDVNRYTVSFNFKWK